MSSINLKGLFSFVLSILFIFFFYSKLALAASFSFCQVAPGDDEKTVRFDCFDHIQGSTFSQELPRIRELSAKSDLEDKGVVFYNPPTYMAMIAIEGFSAATAGPLEPRCFTDVAYEISAFNKLSSADPGIARLKSINEALGRAGICDVAIKRESDSLLAGLGIQTHDQLRQHFLCIANQESVLGKENIGAGGRGPFGIGQDKNQKGQICESLPRAVLLNGKGQELYLASDFKKSLKSEFSKLYEEQEVRNQNATCARLIYERNGLRDWGTSKTSWGSNKKCKAKDRNAYEFYKNLGSAGCCSQACKDRVKEKFGF